MVSTLGSTSVSGQTNSPAASASSTEPRCLEEFDYVSAVSGGSYALGHLVTTSFGGDSSKRLGEVQFTSKTVPGWLWGAGVFFLGVSFQLLKTGALLVAFLTFIAIVLRALDAPDVMRFFGALGLISDVARGFVPFWVTLWIFLTGYGIEFVTSSRRWTRLWFLYSSAVITSYLFNVWRLGAVYPAMTGRFSFALQFAHLAALFVPTLVLCMGVALGQGRRRPLRPGNLSMDAVAVLRKAIRGWIKPHSGLLAPTAGQPLPSVPDDPAESNRGLRLSLLCPLLAALFCFSGLLATDDIGLFMNSDDPTQIDQILNEGQRYGRLGDRVLGLLSVVLGLTSIGLLFPKKLFKSGRRVEDGEQGRKTGEEARALTWFREPVYRVIVFLCSYGFVLLLVFLTYGMVARENISSYFTWRENMSTPAIHIGDFRNLDLAWQTIDRDADPQFKSEWASLANKLMDARKETDFPIEKERSLAAEARVLESLPWAHRLLGWLLPIPMPRAWEHEHPLAESASAARLFEVRTQLETDQNRVLQAVGKVLQNPILIKDLDKDVMLDEKSGIGEAVSAILDRLQPDPGETDEVKAAAAAKSKARRELVEDYWKRAESLKSGTEVETYNAKRSDPDYLAAVANNNRKLLQIYLGDKLLYDRRDKNVFAVIVWGEDQWSRIWLAASASLLWVLCCAVDLNTFSLQKFYRRHVIDAWTGDTPTGAGTDPWLSAVGDVYKGNGRGRPARRAPLPLFNATLEGNRSLGNEPDMPDHIFTFSPFASGYGTGKADHQTYWTTEKYRTAVESAPMRLGPDDKHEASGGDFTEDNDLDLGNIVAASGAFLSPGTVANPALSALLHLLSVQTGYWAHDPGPFSKLSSRESLLFHIAQSAGIDYEGDSRFMLTDGAHVENLGLYALLTRRCKLIVVADCTQEDQGELKERRFDSLVQVLQQAGSDRIHIGPFLNSFGFAEWKRERQRMPQRGGGWGCERKRAVGLDLLLPEAKQPSHPEDDISQEHHLFAEVIYPDGIEGLIVYLRPTLTGDEGDGLILAGRTSAFPDDDPVDQFYTPARMSQYRLLGRHIAEELVSDPVFRKAITGRNPAIDDKTNQTGTRTRPNKSSPCDWCSKGAEHPCLWRRPRAFRKPSSSGESGAGIPSNGSGDSASSTGCNRKAADAPDCHEQLNGHC